MCKGMLEMEINHYERWIAEMQGEKCVRLIKEGTKNLTANGSFNPNFVWSLKKKLFPNYSESPFAILNKDKKLVTDSKSILEVMKDEFAYRLRNRTIEEEYRELIF